MTVKKITNERTRCESYHVVYDKKSRCGNTIERSFRGRDMNLPKAVVEVMLNGICTETRYGSDGTKVEIFEG